MYTQEDFQCEYLIRRGWRLWSKDEKVRGKILLLCPLSEFEKLPDGLEMTSITGDKVVKGHDDIDQDTRGGLLAYGILFSDNEVKIPNPKKIHRSIDDPAEYPKTS